ncbi:MAG: GPW/gp25 family protein [Gemmatimonadetes bacterium]|nr:GPW/gp25 family protein [Gemmatimonadota bacterium]
MPGDNPFLGNGWDFFALTRPREEGGTVALTPYEESVHQSVWLILGTARGERTMRPDFGCGIHDLVFSVNDATTHGRIAQAVRDALVRWEPRIDLAGVEVDDDPSAPTTLRIRIDYRVRATNSRFNLVYPFYLERSPV